LNQKLELSIATERSAAPVARRYHRRSLLCFLDEAKSGIGFPQLTDYFGLAKLLLVVSEVNRVYC
jgi:hypothetical protein